MRTISTGPIRFYREILGLAVLAKEAGRHVFFQVGENQVLLVFRPEATLKGDRLPPHGSRGPGHLAFGIAAAASSIHGATGSARTGWRSSTKRSGSAADGRFIFVIRPVTWSSF